MPDVINASGLQVKTAAEITSELVTGLQGIYGADINTDQNSPDGQMVGIITQIAVDIRELALAVNAGFDPDQALGTILDERVAINSITRRGGTYTVQPIQLNCSAPVSLQGLDGDYSNPDGTGFTVQDDSGNQFILAVSADLPIGITTLNFRAKTIGQVSVPINTITSPVTIVLGVTTVNNVAAAISVGENEETDAQLRTRRQQSVANATTGFLNGLLGTVLDLPGVTEAVLYENHTGATDANGIPEHCIWLIVAGGSSTDIANAIYEKIGYGCDMKGDVMVPITTASGAIFTAQYDQPVAESLYIRFSIKTTIPNFGFDTEAIADYIAENATYAIGAFAETSALTALAIAAIAAQGGGGVPVLMEVSTDGISYTDYVEADTLASQFTVAAANIDLTIVP
jgi:uncharacterized phage protein gp47/JayE